MLTVGVWLKEEWNPEEGGGFTFHRALVEAIDRYAFANANIVFVTAGNATLKLSKRVIRICVDDPAQPQLFSDGQRTGKRRASPRHLACLSTVTGILRTMWSKLVGLAPCAVTNYLRRLFFGTPLPVHSRAQRIDTALCDLVRTNKVDVLYFPIPQHEPVDFDGWATGVPYIASLWDLGHASTFAFPEFTYEGAWSWRDNWSRKISSQALFVFCESEAGRREALTYLKLYPESVGVVPFFLPGRASSEAEDVHDLGILQSMGVTPQNYFFYPAQFWPHKNHYGLLKAFAKVGDERSGLRLVLTGTEKGNTAHVRNLVRALDLADRVVFPGFVDDAAVATLYSNAAALVMPTFLGPTNLPLLEAMQHGCPVICSDFPGHREMLGEAALYIDPTDHVLLAAAMTKMLDPETRRKQLECLSHQKSSSRFTADSAMRAIDGLMPRIEAVRRCWP